MMHIRIYNMFELFIKCADRTCYINSLTVRLCIGFLNIFSNWSKWTTKI